MGGGGGGGGRGGKDFFNFLKSTLLNTALSAAPRTPLCQSRLELNPGLMRLLHWKSGTLTTRLDLILRRWMLYLTRTDGREGKEKCKEEKIKEMLVADRIGGYIAA